MVLAALPEWYCLHVEDVESRRVQRASKGLPFFGEVLPREKPTVLVRTNAVRQRGVEVDRERSRPFERSHVQREPVERGITGQYIKLERDGVFNQVPRTRDVNSQIIGCLRAFGHRDIEVERRMEWWRPMLRVERGA